MKDDIFNEISSLACSIGIELSSEDVGAWATDNGCDERMLENTQRLFSMLAARRHDEIASRLKQKARLPQVAHCSFENFGTGRLTEKDREKLMGLKTLSFIHARKNVVIQGNDGTGKSRIAHAIGNECCEHGLRTYFLTAGELREKMDKATRHGTETRLISLLANYDCLILDSLDKEYFNERESYLFYMIADERFRRTRPGSTVLTTTLDLNLLVDRFANRECYLSAMGRFSTGSICLVLQGKSYWGQDKTVLQLKLID